VDAFLLTSPSTVVKKCSWLRVHQAVRIAGDGLTPVPGLRVFLQRHSRGLASAVVAGVYSAHVLLTSPVVRGGLVFTARLLLARF
jgi:hypothetical protein